MKKIMIFGIPGSGKSTFAVSISEQLQIPVDHLDRHFYIENWIERDYNEFLQIQESLVSQKSWIIDGNCIKSLEMRFQRADVAVYFRFNRLICLWRIYKRLFSKNQSIQDRAEGCHETVRWRLVRYLWNFHKRVSPSIEKLKKQYPNVEFYEIRNSRDLKNFTKKLITTSSFF